MSDNRAALAAHDPAVFAALDGEEHRQREGIELIPSENYTYPEVLAALGSVFTNKYSEGYPGRRYYGGQQFTDTIENIARDRAKELFGAAHANVQALSGSIMNEAVYLALMDPGDTVLGMDLSHGGHLTHGASVSHTGRLFNWSRYTTDPTDGSIDYDAVRATALESQPKIVLCGYSSYPRNLDYAAFRSIADEVGAVAMADIAHIGGLVAAGVMENPLDFGFDIVTTTTHKSLRAARGALILSADEEMGKKIDKSVFPGLQGGPFMNNIAGIAIGLGKALTPEFREYAQQILANAQALAAALIEEGVVLITGGTDNHMMVIETVASFEMDGRQAEQLLDSIHITANKQMIPDDPLPPMRPSGIRLGTPAATSRGMKESEMRQIADWIVQALRRPDDDDFHAKLGAEVNAFCSQFPVPGI